MADSLGISCAFDGGSIDVLDASDPSEIRLSLRADTVSPDTHWFYFRLTGARGRACRMVLTNSHKMSRLAGREEVPDCWTGYRPVASYDGEHWFRVDGEYREGVFSILHTPERDSVYYAYFAPYPMDRHLDLIARCQADPRVRLEVLGQTPDGWDIDMLRFGAGGQGKPKCWIMARQHPSETMGGWFMEGFLERLLDASDPLARHLMAQAEFFVIPTMNPDGCARGHTRTNALGMNLNRAWADPDPATAPEVCLVLDRMEREGVDFALDVHGDEELPYVFLGGPLEIPSRSARIARLFGRYQRAQFSANPDYRPEYPYPGGPPAEADLRMAWNWIGERFGCLSILLEQPFKDTTDTPDPVHGWSPDRSAKLGASTLDALAAVLPALREGGE